MTIRAQQCCPRTWQRRVIHPQSTPHQQYHTNPRPPGWVAQPSGTHSAATGGSAAGVVAMSEQQLQPGAGLCCPTDGWASSKLATDCKRAGSVLGACRERAASVAWENLKRSVRYKPSRHPSPTTLMTHPRLSDRCGGSGAAFSSVGDGHRTAGRRRRRRRRRRPHAYLGWQVC